MNDWKIAMAISKAIEFTKTENRNNMTGIREIFLYIAYLLVKNGCVCSPASIKIRAICKKLVSAS